MSQRRFKPVGFLLLGIIFLVVPTAVYLVFLIPQMSEEYIILMSSGGAIGGAGMLGTHVIPESTKYGTLYKTASRSFTMLVVITLVQDFLRQLIGLAAVIIVSYIIFIIFKEAWKHARLTQEHRELAAEITRSITEAAE